MAKYIDVIFYDHLFGEKEGEKDAKVNDLGVPNFSGMFHDYFSIFTTVGVIVIGNCN